MSPFYLLDYILIPQIMKIDNQNCKEKVPLIICRTSLVMTLYSLVLLSMSATFLLSSILQTSFAQSSSSSSSSSSSTTAEIQLSQVGGQAGNQLAQLDAARQQYLSAWNNTAFTSQLDAFIGEGSDLGYGIYREHVPANVFRPGETIVLYVEPVGYGHQPITDRTTNQEDGRNSSNSATSNATLYLMNMTADYIISDSSGSELQTIKDVPVGNLISHRHNLELFLTLTLRQDAPFPVGEYVVSYVVHDQVTGQSFQLDRRITIDDNAATGALPLPDNNNGNNSAEQALPQ
jgi:hypothetical protein